MSHQTGPRTPEGKAQSSQNNRRHGLSTANIIVHPGQQSIFDEMEAELRNEVQPDGPLETHAFQRLITAAWQIEQCRKQEGSLVVFEPTTEDKAHLDKVHRYYLRWEGSYNSAFRQIRLLQTGRAVKMVSEGAPSEPFPPSPISLRLNSLRDEMPSPSPSTIMSAANSIPNSPSSPSKSRSVSKVASLSPANSTPKPPAKLPLH